MASRTTTLGDFIAEQMNKHQHTNRSLATAAGISEGAVRNLLKYGTDKKAKDPSPRILRLVADALAVNPLRFYKLAGYLPPEPDAHSARADHFADIFDRLPSDKQEAVLGVIDVMAGDSTVRKMVEQIRDDPENPLAGFDLQSPHLLRVMANELIAHYQMTEPTDINRIEEDAQVFNYQWSSLPQATQERIKALIRHKLSLDYDPTMVDPEWRE